MNATRTERATSAQTYGAPNWSWRVLGVLGPVALMLLLVTTNVRLATNSVPLHLSLFERHNVTQRSGITAEGLRSVDREVLHYFNTEMEPLYVEAEVYGLRRSLFSEPEVVHMADVKKLFNLTWRVQGAAALFLGLTVLASIAYLRGGAWRMVATWVRNGAMLSGGAILAIGAVAAVAFDPLFTLFHRLGFRNDLWLLDPRRDLLVQIYPFGFWQEITLLIGLAALVEAVLLFFAARRLLRRQSRQTALRK